MTTIATPGGAGWDESPAIVRPARRLAFTLTEGATRLALTDAPRDFDARLAFADGRLAVDDTATSGPRIAALPDHILAY